MLDWASTSSGGAGPNVVRLDMALGGASVSISGGNSNDTEASLSLPMAVAQLVLVLMQTLPLTKQYL